MGRQDRTMSIPSTVETRMVQPRGLGGLRHQARTLWPGPQDVTPSHCLLLSFQAKISKKGRGAGRPRASLSFPEAELRILPRTGSTPILEPEHPARLRHLAPCPAGPSHLLPTP